MGYDMHFQMHLHYDKILSEMKKDSEAFIEFYKKWFSFYIMGGFLHNYVGFYNDYVASYNDYNQTKKETIFVKYETIEEFLKAVIFIHNFKPVYSDSSTSTPFNQYSLDNVKIHAHKDEWSWESIDVAQRAPWLLDLPKIKKMVHDNMLNFSSEHQQMIHQIDKTCEEQMNLVNKKELDEIFNINSPLYKLLEQFKLRFEYGYGDDQVKWYNENIKYKTFNNNTFSTIIKFADAKVDLYYNKKRENLIKDMCEIIKNKEEHIEEEKNKLLKLKNDLEYIEESHIQRTYFKDY